MNPVALPDLVARIGQAAVAEALGVSPAAIHKAVRSGRKIFVTVHEDGTCTGEETRPFPCQEGSRTSQKGERQANSLSPV
ncbi:Cro/Cl family transcriptional regulator [Pseudomonas sp. SWRI51]|uniref:Cro/CI family transcriptional regulator n=1 Tax=Pseudomonas sp. SWRI51 TaxID=2745491 RepID=UPI00164796B7|nr:Cro/CI family transcriptional regulator [Pseudomonas sp. SWRI51]MBC3410071.1 Cro/Cl family transcriptional regulator [Pseudomonas sp. SWRI51]